MTYKIPKAIRSGLFLVPVACLTACSPNPAAVRAERSRDQAEVFSAEDRRVAKALSLGGAMDTGAQSSADEAATCVVALNYIRQRVKLSRAYTSALDKAIGIYRERAGTNAMSAAEFADRLKAAEATMPEEADQASASVRCLKAFE